MLTKKSKSINPAMNLFIIGSLYNFVTVLQIYVIFYCHMIFPSLTLLTSC